MLRASGEKPVEPSLRRQPQLSPAHDDRQNVGFLLCLCQPRNNRGDFLEYLVPALHLTAFFRALHGFIADEGQFRAAVA